MCNKQYVVFMYVQREVTNDEKQTRGRSFKRRKKELRRRRKEGA